VRLHRSIAIVSILLVLVVTGCGDDDSASPDDSRAPDGSASTQAPVTSVVPRADDDVTVTGALVPVDGYRYDDVDDTFVLPVFRELIAAPGSDEVIERFGARLVTDEADDESFAMLFAGRLAPEHRDGRSFAEVFAQRQTSRVIGDQRVFVVRVITQTELGEAFRYTWARNGFIYSAYGESEARVEAFIGALVAVPENGGS